MNKRLVITGANGQLGKELEQVLFNAGYTNLILCTRENFDLAIPEKIPALLETLKPDYLINCAAYTAVDKAEEETELAMQINGHSVGILAAECKRNGCRLIHISTDYVFDGLSAVPYTVDDHTKPINAYGASKRLGEELALKADPSAIIIRTAWVYSPFGNNFVKTMIRLMRSKETINVVSDQIGSPTYGADLAAAILEIIRSDRWVPGIYHYSNSGRISWFQFAVAIKELIGSNCNIIPITSSAYPTAAKRPFFSLLATDKISTIYKINISDWEESLKKCISRIPGS